MSEVRVRIAPSPTGDPHVGTAYIALFNIAFARKHGGRFLVRIDDTDQTRSRPEYEKGILDSLNWLGLTWDEGPGMDNDWGPFRQSERTEHYREAAKRLLESGHAYRCFCSSEDLERIRIERAQMKLGRGYDGRCRKIDPEESGRRAEAGEAHVVRLAVPQEGDCRLQDEIRGEIVTPFKEVDDQILMKSDGFPTYHLANVVDDHRMRITHVIRGREWISSVPKHLLLYQALEWEPPCFYHMPLLLNPDGTKLSKRKNPTSIRYYQQAGYLPEALLNFLGMMGYSRPGGEEKFSLEELISDFEPKRLHSSDAVFDIQKLRWLNGRYLREDLTPEDLYQRLTNWRMNESLWKPMAELMLTRMETLGDFVPSVAFTLADDFESPAEDFVPKKRTPEETVQFLQTILWAFEEDDAWDKENVQKTIERVTELWNWKIREATAPLFVAIMGKKVGPPLYDSIAILGKDLSRARILKGIVQLGDISKKKLRKLEKRWKSGTLAPPASS
ncbi:MAG: glutamate--tRNA ligase [Planctomycetota bacterium]|jgi:glutamyl-tRNA synthetase|nr:glutamate--tRNA ligase [Planctomycetota bacterium]